MAANNVSAIKISHPAPHRGRIGLATLLFGISAAPAAWNVQLLFSVALSGRNCYPHANPLAAPLWNGLRPVLFAISLAAIVLAIIGGLVALRSWRKTFDESAGSAHHLLDRGEGRTRFMAMAGMLVSALFLIALAFGTAALCLVPLCGQ
jgi:hypothetical protein